MEEKGNAYSRYGGYVKADLTRVKVIGWRLQIKIRST